MTLLLCLLFGSRDDVSCNEKTYPLSIVSPQSQQIEFHFIITNRLFDMWPLFNRLVIDYNLPKCSPYTSYKKLVWVFLSERFSLKVAGNSFQYFSRLRVWWVIITLLYLLTPTLWYQQTAQSSGNKLLLILWHNFCKV